MDYYQIGAMKVFSELGQFIEEDERNQIKLSDLNSDIMQKIGSYLLEDKNKTIHKIFKNRPDDDLQVLLFGEVKDLTYVNIYNSDNEIDYKMNDKLKNYVNFILKAKGSKRNCEKMRVQFYIHTYKNPNIKERRVEINFYNKEDKQIAAIKDEYHIGGLMGIGGGYHLKLMYKESADHPWKKQGIQKNDIIKEYNYIQDEIKKKYF
jgi:hypothetical protein